MPLAKSMHVYVYGKLLVYVVRQVHVPGLLVEPVML